MNEPKPSQRFFANPMLASVLQPTIETMEGAKVQPDALLLIGFPAAGMVGPIVTSYLANSLSMEFLGSVTSLAYAPLVRAERGQIFPATRLYQSPLYRGSNGKSEQLLVLESDLQLDPLLLKPLAATVMDWAREHGVGTVVDIEGAAVTGAEPGEPPLVGVANSFGVAVLQQLKLRPMGGLISGFPAAILLAGLHAPPPVLAIVSQAHPDYPDANAAARAIEALRPLMPSIPIDTKDLLAEAEQFERAVKARVAAAATPPQKEGPAEMFG